MFSSSAVIQGAFHAPRHSIMRYLLKNVPVHERMSCISQVCDVMVTLYGILCFFKFMPTRDNRNAKLVYTRKKMTPLTSKQNNRLSQTTLFMFFASILLFTMRNLLQQHNEQILKTINSFIISLILLHLQPALFAVRYF